MKKLIDKIQAIYCILTSKEYIIYTCNDFNSSKGAKEWHSYGIEDKNPNYNVFLEAAKEHIERLSTTNI